MGTTIDTVFEVDTTSGKMFALRVALLGVFFVGQALCYDKPTYQVNGYLTCNGQPIVDDRDGSNAGATARLKVVSGGTWIDTTGLKSSDSYIRNNENFVTLFGTESNQGSMWKDYYPWVEVDAHCEGKTTFKFNIWSKCVKDDDHKKLWVCVKLKLELSDESVSKSKKKAAVKKKTKEENKEE